jgi:hypothetical protein
VDGIVFALIFLWKWIKKATINQNLEVLPMNRISFEYEPYQGQFFLTVNSYPVLLYEKDLRDISPYVKSYGSTGQDNLCEWFRIHRPLFYKHIITEYELNKLILDILSYLKRSRFFLVSNNEETVKISNKTFNKSRNKP